MADDAGAPAVNANLFNQELEVDTFSDRDSALGDADQSTITTSVTSSVLNYRFDHGRRYHAFEDDAYCLPNDDHEVARLDMLHHMWKLSLDGSLHVAPIPDTVRNVIDIGTGSGAWAIDFADAHPAAEVLGTDLSPIQPSWIPSNCKFMVENAEAEWTYERPFDYIHVRFTMLGIRNWPRMINQIWDNLEPGGWLELFEPTIPLGYRGDAAPTNSALYDYIKCLSEAQKVNGVDTLAALKFGELLEAQGFVNIGYRSTQWAVGPWPKGKRAKEIGYWARENMRNHITGGIVGLFTKTLGMTAEEVKDLMDRALAELDMASVLLYWPIHIYWAQKPENSHL